MMKRLNDCLIRLNFWTDCHNETHNATWAAVLEQRLRAIGTDIADVFERQERAWASIETE